MADTTIDCWGHNGYYELGDGTNQEHLLPNPVLNSANTGPLRNQVWISVSQYDSCSVQSDGSARCWGLNQFGTLGDGTEAPRARPAGVKAAALDDQVKVAQELRDIRAARDDLERRVYDLKLTRQVTMQSLPSIRLVQENDKSLVGKINSTLVNTVPLWETQLAQAVRLADLEAAAEDDLAARPSHHDGEDEHEHNDFSSVVSVLFGESSCSYRPTRRCLALCLPRRPFSRS